MSEGLLSRKEVANALGCHPQQVSRLVADGMPVAKRGGRGRSHGYRLEDVQSWIERREAAARNGAGDLDAVRERALKERAQRHLAEQTLKTRAGELVAKDEVIAAWSAHASAVRTKLSAIPGLLDIDDAARARLAVLIRETLEELADGDDNPRATENPPSRARSKRRAKGSKGRTSRKRGTKRKAKAKGPSKRRKLPAKAKKRRKVSK